MKKLIISFLVTCLILNSTLPSVAMTIPEQIGQFIVKQKIIDVIQTEELVSKDIEKRLKSF